LLLMEMPSEYSLSESMSSTPSQTTFCIGTDFPTTDTEASQGNFLKHGANLANSSELRLGFRLQSQCLW
jgi:hypothetical protein